MTAPSPEELRALAAEVYDDHYEDDDPDTSGPHWRESCGTHTRAMHRALLAAADEIESQHLVYRDVINRDWEARWIEREKLHAEERDRLRAELAEARREADRLRHGAPIEGDHVCPDSQALAVAMSMLQTMHESMEMRDWYVDDYLALLARVRGR